MKNIYILLCLIAAIILSCAKDNRINGSGEGFVDLSLMAGNENLIIRTSKSGGEELSLSDLIYSLTVTNSDGVVVKRVDDLGASDNKVSLLAKIYKFKIESGKLLPKGFDTPYYIAEKDIEVVANKLTSVDMKLKLGNVKVTVEYDQNLSQYLSNCETLITLAANSLTFGMEETRAGYFKLDEGGSTTLNWSLSLFPINGAEQVEAGSVKDVKVNDHIKLKFSVEDGDYETGGLRIVAIKVVEDVIDQNKDLNIGIERYPEVNLIGGNINEIQNVIASTNVPITIELAAFPEIKSVQMSYNMKIIDGTVEDGGDPNDGASYELLLILKKADGSTIVDLESKGIYISYMTPSIDKCKNSIKVLLSSQFLASLKNSSDDSEPYSFHFSIAGTDNKTMTKTLMFNKINSDVVTIEPKANDAWATKIEFTGKWVESTKPSNLSFSYSEDGVIWNDVTATKVDDATQEFSAVVTGLKPSTEYRYRAVGNQGSNLVKVATEPATQLYNSSFDKWSKEGSAWYVRESSAYSFWDSGNKGATTIGSNNPTEPEDNDVVNAPNRAARLTSKVIVGNFAAGNLFAGQFINVDVIGGAIPEMTFGRPFISRPFALEGKYKYNSKTINYDSRGGLSGKPDRFSMFILITNGDNMPRYLKEKNKSPFDLDKIMTTGTDGNVKAIASGMFTNEKFENGVDVTKALAMNGYENFKIELKYHESNKNLQPLYVVVVFSASKYGDFFTGGEGSCLLLDEVKLNYDFK